MKEVLFHLYQLRQEFSAASLLPSAKLVCAYKDHNDLCVMSSIPCPDEEIDFATMQRIHHAVTQAGSLLIDHYDRFVMESGIQLWQGESSSFVWCRYIMQVAGECGWHLENYGDAVYLADLASYSACVVTDMITEELETLSGRGPEYLGVTISGRSVERHGFPAQQVSFVRAARQFTLFKILLEGGESGVSRSDIRDRLYESNPVNEAALDTRSSDCNKRLEPIALEIAKNDGRWFLRDKRKVYKK